MRGRQRFALVCSILLLVSGRAGACVAPQGQEPLESGYLQDKDLAVVLDWSALAGSPMQRAEGYSFRVGGKEFAAVPERVPGFLEPLMIVRPVSPLPDTGPIELVARGMSWKRTIGQVRRRTGAVLGDTVAHELYLAVRGGCGICGGCGPVAVLWRAPVRPRVLFASGPYGEVAEVMAALRTRRFRREERKVFLKRGEHPVPGPPKKGYLLYRTGVLDIGKGDFVHARSYVASQVDHGVQIVGLSPADPLREASP
jgi:hypothetical protein